MGRAEIANQRDELDQALRHVTEALSPIIDHLGPSPAAYLMKRADATALIVKQAQTGRSDRVHTARS